MGKRACIHVPSKTTRNTYHNEVSSKYAKVLKGDAKQQSIRTKNGDFCSNLLPEIERVVLKVSHIEKVIDDRPTCIIGLARAEDMQVGVTLHS